MTDKQKRYETEWTFSFEGINERIRNAFQSAGEEPVEEHFSVPYTGEKALTVKIGGMVGKHTITSLQDSATLFEADTRSAAPVTFVTEDKEGRKTIKLKAPDIKSDVVGSIKRTIGSIGKKENLRWDVRIHPDVALKLHIDGGVSQGEFDLSAMNLTHLSLDGGVGQTIVHLPATDAPYEVKIDGGVGETVINIPANASGNLFVDGGIGNTVIRVAAGVAVRVTADGGIGGVHVPSDYKRTTTGDNIISKSGVWESEGYALSERQINIEFDGGVGNFTVKQDKAEVV